MILVTKIVRFEAAHVLHQYSGACGRIHGHSYELHVTVRRSAFTPGYLEGTGMVVDFKTLKETLNDEILCLLDHRLLVSQKYLDAHQLSYKPSEMTLFEGEPTAENILVLVSKKLTAALPADVKLDLLRLWETKDSYAELRVDS